MGQRRAESAFAQLVATARRLQAPGGCAWDRAQTVQSLLPYLLEETWEVFEVIRSRRRKELQEELGDVLYTVLFLTLVAERRGWLSLEALLTATRKKMVRRHPHVFGPHTASSPREAYRHWHATKQLEGRRRHSPSKALRAMLLSWWEWAYTHPGAEGRLRNSGRLLAERPGQPVPNQRKRESNRKAKHQTGQARVQKRKHRKVLSRATNRGR